MLVSIKLDIHRERPDSRHRIVPKVSKGGVTRYTLDAKRRFAEFCGYVDTNKMIGGEIT